MKRKATLKWFTLIEMLIVIVIIWILAVVLTESYITISRTALRIEQEKNLSEESLILTQVFQSIADEATIDYNAYSGNEIDLSETNWFIDILYLTWGQRSWTSIYTTWWENCLELDNNFPMEDNWTYPDYSEKIQNALSWCELILQQWDDNTTSLISNWKVITSKVMFRIIPYDSDENYFSSEKYKKEFGNDSLFAMKNIHQPAFWMFVHLYAPFYQPKWTNKIDQPLQLFFNLNL